jgi:hypothetical protein
MGKQAKKASLDQYQRFVEATRELGCDESEERFAEVVRTVAKAHVPSASEIKASAKAARKPERKS